jgi:integrase
MLYRRPNSRHWWVRITTPDGREVRKSSGTEVKKDAEEYEATLKTQLWRQARLGEKPRHTWQEAVVRWVTETGHKASHEDDLCHLRWLDQHLTGKQLENVDRDAIDAIQKKRKDEGSSNATANRTLALVRSILRRAEREWGWIDRAPAVRLLPEPKRRIRWLAREEADRLIAELPTHLADMMRFSLATGLRESNVTGLRWDQVDLGRRVAWIHADEAKAGRAIGVPLNSDAVLVLQRWVGGHPERVFTFKGKPVTKAGGAAWKKAMVRSGIENFRWHDLRHTWASWHVQAGTPLHVLQELGGWSSAEMVRRYAHLAPGHLAEHARTIEERVSVVEN